MTGKEKKAQHAKVAEKEKYHTRTLALELQLCYTENKSTVELCYVEKKSTVELHCNTVYMYIYIQKKKKYSWTSL